MHYILNEQQEQICQEAINWYKYSSEQVFQISGGPGTGKSVLLHEIVRRLGLPYENLLPMAYIGAAAINMRTKGFYNAKTIHSSLYRPIETYKTDENGNLVMNTYLNRPEVDSAFEEIDVSYVDLMIIDEGGSVPFSHKASIENRGKKILVAGDLDQLPPVKDTPAYLYSGKVHRLTQTMRQLEGSGMIYISKRALQGLPIHPGYYGDCLVIPEDELNDIMIYNADMILCGTNKTREAINNRVRYDILRINSDLPCYGEKVVCRKNNWKIELDGISLANGLVGRVVNQPGIHAFDGKTYAMDFMPNLMNRPFKDLRCDYKYLTAPPHLRNMIKKDKFSQGEKMEFANAITTHMAQGSQFHHGIYIEEYLSRDIQKNLNYVGASRFTRGMIYVVKKRKYYPGFNK